MSEKKRIALYVRVSTGKEEQKSSLEHQDEGLRERAIREGHEIVGVYKDDGKTATKVYNRPDFMRLLHDAGIDHTYVYTDKKLPNGNVDRRSRARQIVFFESEREPLFDEIWVKNTSRLFRNLFFSEQILNILKNKKVAVFFVEQGFRTDQVSVEILIKICSIFDEQESKDKSSKVRWGYEQSFKNNNLRGKGPYGYYYDKVNKRLIIKEDEAAVIRKIFDLYVNKDFGIRRVLNALNEEKILTPDGKPFAKTTLRRILSNPKYAGYNNLQKRWDSGVVFNKHSPREKRYGEYEIAPNPNIEPIITLEMFEAAQAKTKERNNNELGVYKGNSTYSQRLICGCCGSIYISNQDRGRRFFNCKLKKSKGTKFCNNPNVSVTKFERWLDEEASRLSNVIKEQHKAILLLEYRHIIDAARELNSDNSTKIAAYKEEIKALQAETRGFTRQKSFYFEKHEMTENDKKQVELLDSYINENIEKIEQIEAKISELNNRVSVLLDEIKTSMSHIEKIATFKYEKGYNRDDVLEFYERFTVEPDGNISPMGYMYVDWDAMKNSGRCGEMVTLLKDAYKTIKIYLPDIYERYDHAEDMAYI